MASDLFWHVPVWDENRPPTNQLGVPSVGKNAFVELVQTDTASSNLAPDNYWVERIVGQVLYQRIAVEPDSGSWFVHSRVYVTPASTTGIVLRDLASADDADTSWMMHTNQLMFETTTGETGNWQQAAGAGTPDTYTAPMPRKGSFDIRVGRKVAEGESLIWHAQIEPTILANLIDAQLNMRMWIRVLLRQL